MPDTVKPVILRLLAFRFNQVTHAAVGIAYRQGELNFTWQRC